MLMENRPEQYTAHAANSVHFIGSYMCILGAGEKKKKNRADNCLLFKTTLKWTMDQKNTLLYGDVVANPSLDTTVDNSQQKGEGEQNQTSNQPGCNRLMECTELGGSFTVRAAKGTQNQNRSGYGELTNSTKHGGDSLGHRQV